MTEDIQTNYVEDGETEYVVVTGVSSGIGHAITVDLTEQGYHVFGSVRTQEDADRVQAEFGERFMPLIFDVTDGGRGAQGGGPGNDSVGEIGLAGLVNNAGIAVGGPLMHLPIDEMRRQLVNVVGVLQVTQAFPALARRTARPALRVRPHRQHRTCQRPYRLPLHGPSTPHLNTPWRR